MVFGIISGVPGCHGSRANSIHGEFFEQIIHKFNVQTVSGGSTEITAEIRTHPYIYIYINIYIYIHIYMCERAASKSRRFLHFGGSGPHPFYLVLHQRSPLPFAEVSIQGTPYLWIWTPRVPRLPLDQDTKGPPLPPLDPDSKSSLPTPCPLTSLEFR